MLETGSEDMWHFKVKSVLYAYQCIKAVSYNQPALKYSVDCFRNSNLKLIKLKKI